MKKIHHSLAKRHPSASGFSLVELLFSISILTLILAGIILTMITILRRDDVLTKRLALMTDGQQLASFLRTTTRLSSINEMVMYPSTAPHTSISYPIPSKKDNSGNEVLTPEGQLVWGETLIIHSWPANDPTELRLTRFNPRDNSLSTGDRETQLEDVATNGNGANTLNGLNSTTRTLAELKPEFSFRPDGGTYNFYAAQSTRDRNAAMGGVRLNSGDNKIVFRAKDKSSASGGYGWKIDRLRISPAGLAIEAESLLPVSSQSGGSAISEEKTLSTWSDRKLFSFPANSIGAETQLNFFNDTWHETLFLGNGSTLENSVTDMNTTEGDVGTRLRPSGREPAWFASFQAASDGEGKDDDMAYGVAMRVILRGTQASGGYIISEGDGCKVTFRASDQSGKSFRIKGAYISEAADHINPGPSIVTDTTEQLQFGSPDNPRTGTLVRNGNDAETVPVDFAIDPEKSYVISYWVDPSTPDEANPWHWYKADSPPSTYLLSATSNPNRNDLLAASWNGRAEMETVKGIVGVKSLETTYVNEAVYTSRIVDTTLTTPTYHDLDWDGVYPENTTVGFQVRTGNQPDLSDAPSWENISEMFNPGTLNVGSGRFVQVRITMSRDKVLDEIPELRSFTLRWWGEPAYIDFGGDFQKFSSGGIMEVLVNGVPPSSTLRAELQMTSKNKTKEDQADTWKLMVESTPRN